MTEGKPTLLQNKTIPNNYRPVMCLSMMRKILTAQIGEFTQLNSADYLQKNKKDTAREQKGYVSTIYR